MPDAKPITSATLLIETLTDVPALPVLGIKAVMSVPNLARIARDREHIPNGIVLARRDIPLKHRPAHPGPFLHLAFTGRDLLPD